MIDLKKILTRLNKTNLHVWVKYSQMRFQYFYLWLKKKKENCLLKCKLYTRISMLVIEESKYKIVYNLNIWEFFHILLWSTLIYLILYKDTRIKFDEAKSIKRT